jgi:hypothetical protein
MFTDQKIVTKIGAMPQENFYLAPRIVDRYPHKVDRVKARLLDTCGRFQ